MSAQNSLPLARQTVAIGNASTTTDENGRFIIRQAPARYDLVVVNETRSIAALYVGVSRRDPIVVQHIERDAERATRHAEVSVTLADSSEPWSVEGARMHLFGPFVTTDLRGSSFGPYKIAWDGPASFQADVIALQKEESPARTVCGRATVTLNDTEKSVAALTLKEVPTVHRSASRIRYPRNGFSEPEVYASYHFPGTPPVLNAMTSRMHDYDVPDLQSCGAVLCNTAFIYNPYLHSRASSCGAVSAKAVELNLPNAPKFTQPSFGTSARAGLRFAWSALRGAIYELTISPTHPSPAAPSFRVFTRDPSAIWPDLAAFGVPFPKPLNAYGASVHALGPYKTLDEALGPEGLSFETRAADWSSESQKLSVPVDPPVGKEEAACQYPYGTVIVCGKPDNSVEHVAEHYMLAAINNKLRHYPDFANATNIHCVRDCAGGRAFFAAYAEYSRTHPAFDRDEPLEPTPPPPPPPPAVWNAPRRTH